MWSVSAQPAVARSPRVVEPGTSLCFVSRFRRHRAHPHAPLPRHSLHDRRPRGSHREPPRARRGSRTSHVLRASERRAQSSDDADESGADGDKLMGRRGTFREAKEDDEATANVKKSVKLDARSASQARRRRRGSCSSARRAPITRGVPRRSDGAAKPANEADPVMTSLCVAMEDDAFKSRTAVCLPVDAYVKRVDKLVTEFMQDFPTLDVPEGARFRTRRTSSRRSRITCTRKTSTALPGCARRTRRTARTSTTSSRRRLAFPRRSRLCTSAASRGCARALTEDVDVMIVQKAKGSLAGAGVTAPKVPWGASARAAARRTARAARWCARPRWRSCCSCRL